MFNTTGNSLRRREGFAVMRPVIGALTFLPLCQDVGPSASPGVAASPGSGGAPAPDLSSISRSDLEELCGARGQKLQQAVTKIRSIHADYKRVQRDYEQLQGIVRSDAQARSPDAPDDAAARVEELTAEKEALKEQLDAMRGECERLREGAAGGVESGASTAEESAAKIAELEAALKHKEEVRPHLTERIN